MRGCGLRGTNQRGGGGSLSDGEQLRDEDEVVAFVIRENPVSPGDRRESAEVGEMEMVRRLMADAEPIGEVDQSVLLVPVLAM